MASSEARGGAAPARGREGEAPFQVPSSAASASQIESSVTKLLLATKMLLEALTRWSQQKESDAHVSQIYVRLGHDFNAALALFLSAGVPVTYVDH